MALRRGDFDSSLRRALGVKDQTRLLRFSEGDRDFHCFVPDDALWIAVKDVLVLAEYERNGIELSQMHGTVIDAGAHVGLFALKAAAHARHVFAIEPHPVNADMLELNLRKNGVGQVELLRQALWSERSTLTLYEGTHTTTSSLSRSGSHSHIVETVTLDEIVESAGEIDLLKLDVEGAEFDIIAHAPPHILRSIRSIVAELHLYDSRTAHHALVTRLRSLGFNVTILPPPIQAWSESMSRLGSNWRKLHDNLRLKLLVAAIYTAHAVALRLLPPERLHSDPLALLYAQRSPHGT